MNLNSKFQKPIVYLRPALKGRVTKWLCGGLQIRIRGFKSLPALLLFLIIMFILFSGRCSSKILINEVMYDPELNDNYYEWVELYNPTNQSINLSGWSLIDNSAEDFVEGNYDHGNGTTIIPPFSYALITDHGTKFYNNYTVSNDTVKLYIDDSAIGNGLSNSGDKLILKNYQNETIDAIEWIKNYTDVPGNPAFGVKEGCSLARYSTIDINNSSQDFFESDTPTPGSKNDIDEKGKTIITCNQSYFLIKKNEKLKIYLEVTNAGDFYDNITTKITSITDGWTAQIDNKIVRLGPNNSTGVDVTITSCQYNCYNIGKITFIALSEKENNTSDEITLTFEIYGPDLYIKKIKGYNENSVETNTYGEGEIIKIKAFLKNQGKENATDVEVRFYLDLIKPSNYIGSKFYDKVGKYQKYPSIKIDTHGFSIGRHTIIVIADKNNVVDEFNELNNELTFQIEITNTHPEKNSLNLLITDVYYHSHPGLYNEYIGLYNPTNTEINLSGWYLTNEPLDIKTEQLKMVFPNNTILSEKKKIIISERANTYEWETGKKPDFEYNNDTDFQIPQMIANNKFIMSNKGKMLALKDPHNHTIDFLTYGNMSIDSNFWRGKAIPLSGEGVVLRRNFNKQGCPIDTNSSEDWISNRKFKIGQSNFHLEKFNVTGEITTFTSPDCSHEILINEIKKSNHSIYINIYEFSDPFLCDSLIDVLLRNVPVNIFLEGSPVGGISDEEKYVLNRIVNYGGNVRFIVNDKEDKVYARYNFDHGKYLIIDNKTTIVESCNWVKTGIPKNPSYGNREWGIIVRNENISKYFLNVFLNDWNPERCDSYSFHELNLSISHDFYMDNSIFKGSYESQFEAKTVVDNFTATPVFSPDTSFDAICNMIDLANKSIYIEQLYIYKNWTDKINPFVERLINKSKQDVDIKIILNYNPVYEDTNEKNNITKQYFEENGIEVKFIYTNWSYFSNVHNKGMIIDNKSVLISSINWNENSVTRNREAGIIIENEDVAKYYANIFFYDWNLNSPVIKYQNVTISSSVTDYKNTIYIVVIFTLTFALIARDWRKRQWT